jgi:hypothetical protein
MRKEENMTLIAPPLAAEPPPLARRHQLRLTAAAPSLWRLLDSGGRVVGHVQVVDSARGPRYRARRFHAPSRAFRELGEFWSADDAVECVAFSR